MFGRTVGIKYALELLQSLKPEGATIVETGATNCIGGCQIEGQGEATPVFSWYSQVYNGFVHTIDVVELHLSNCKELVAKRAGGQQVEYHLGVASDVIPTIEGKIDLLYIDSSDDPQVALEEFNAAKEKFTPETILFIDDTHGREGNFTGKGELVYEMLISDGGWKVAYHWQGGGQLIMVRADIELQESLKNAEEGGRMPPCCCPECLARRGE